LGNSFLEDSYLVLVVFGANSVPLLEQLLDML